jgi:hypothetical protein
VVAGKTENTAEQGMVGADQPLAVRRGDDGDVVQRGELQDGADRFATRAADQQPDLAGMLEVLEQFVGGFGIKQGGRSQLVGDVVGRMADGAGTFHDVQRNAQVDRAARRAHCSLQRGDQFRLDLFRVRDQRVVARAVAEHAERVDAGAR